MQKLFTIRPWKACTITVFRTGTDHRGAANVEVVVLDEGKQVFGPDTEGMRLTGSLSPFWSDDGDDAKRYALTFAGMKPGDTEADFFDDYTPAQLLWAKDHGDDLTMIAYDRYGED